MSVRNYMDMCVGQICEKKNQRLVVRTCNSKKLPFVGVLGKRIDYSVIAK